MSDDIDTTGWHRAGRGVALLVVVGLLALAGCSDDGTGEATGPLMSPGEDCFACHYPAGTARETIFSAAGTIFDADGVGRPGVTVAITDRHSRFASAVTNEAGNFIMEDALESPLEITVTFNGAEVGYMGIGSSGACNFCHRYGGEALPITVP